MIKSICFTGHRTLSGNTADLEKLLYSTIERGILNEGITDFYCGGAIGWDTLSAQTVLKLRESYPQIRLNLILPCSPQEQTIRWSDKQRAEYTQIMNAADKVEQTAQSYYDGCMKVRNARLVELADCCFCYWDSNRKRSGTAQTVRMAQKKGIMVVNFYMQY